MLLTFLLSATPDYLPMAQAMVNSLRHFHPEGEIIMYVFDKAHPHVADFALNNADVKIEEYDPPAFTSRGWHPLVWAKFEVFRLQNADIAIFLDVDQLMYNSLTEHIQNFEASGKCFGSACDDESFAEQFIGVKRLEIEHIPDKALNTGVIMTWPDAGTYEAIMSLAEKHHHNARLPTQAILNLFSLNNSHAWEDLGENLMIHPYSPRVLEQPRAYSLIHFWTPRPPFFGVSPRRAGELTYQQARQQFMQEIGVEYPEQVFAQDYRNRLDNMWK